MTAAAARKEARAADAAASDAARDARAEAMEQAEPPKVSRVSKTVASKAVQDGWYHFVVDIWITNFNRVEFGIYKRSRNRAKSRQFTSDMDMFAEVLEGGERTGLIGYREELWEKAQGMDKRLVFKLFSETLNWRATMDLMIGRSLQPGPMSRIQSAARMVSSSCSTTSSVLPRSRSRLSVRISRALSRWCSPMLGSSRM